MKFPLGEMTVGDILDRGLKLLFARLPAFYVINLLVLGPVIVLQLVAPFAVEVIGNGGAGGGGNPLDPVVILGGAGIGLYVLFLTLVLQPIGNAAILHVIMEEYAGNRVGVGTALSYALRRFLPLLGVSIVVGLMVFVGTMLCCLPGIYLAIIYAFVGQIVVLERLGVGEALSRSSELVKGFWWRVFGVLFLVGFVNAVIQGTVGGVLGAVMPAQEVIPGPNGPQVQLNPLNHSVTTLVSVLVGIVFTTYTAVCTTLLYLDLRIRKEGYDLELAALRGGDDDYDRPRRRDDEYDDYDNDDDRPRRRRRDDDYDDDYDDRGRR
ncbi:hypothetical protein J0H58_23380 [bacterium]|nr:hypothetical protein [bacterium]